MTDPTSKCVAIMQPYFLPYLGYFQLLTKVDRFVVYDDVQYMVGGWVNRNRIYDSKKDWRYLNVQLRGASPNKLIHEIEVDSNSRWRRKALGTIKGTYGRSPFAKEVMPIAEEIIQFNEPGLSSFLVHSLKLLSETLGINTEIEPSSRIYKNTDLDRLDRIIDICRIENSDHYINAIGGKELYGKKEFSDHGIRLSFLEPDLSFPKHLVPPEDENEDLSLSILHLLFRYGPEVCKHLIHQGNLV